MLGLQITETDLLPVFTEMLSDVDEVRVALIQHAADFVLVRSMYSTCDCNCIVTLNDIVQWWHDYGNPTYAAYKYVDLRAAFDSLSWLSLSFLLSRLGIPDKTVRLIRALYSKSVSCVHASQSESALFTIESGVRQGCVLAPDFFAMGMD